MHAESIYRWLENISVKPPKAGDAKWDISRTSMDPKAVYGVKNAGIGLKMVDKKRRRFADKARNDKGISPKWN